MELISVIKITEDTFDEIKTFRNVKKAEEQFKEWATNFIDDNASDEEKEEFLDCCLEDGYVESTGENLPLGYSIVITHHIIED